MPIGILPDYPLWSWEASNGSATDAQVQAAYNAIRNQGYTRDFSRLVWNDLVSLLSDAITAAGLTWDAKCTTAEGAKISEDGDGTLTAAMFNSVTHNLDQINPGFLWEWDKTQDPGYTGRLAFQSGEKVYGWYLEELALVLNSFLALLRGDENYIHLLRCGTNIPAPRRGKLLVDGKLLLDQYLIPAPHHGALLAAPGALPVGRYLVPVPQKGVLLPAPGVLAMDQHLTPAPRKGELLAAPGALPKDGYVIATPRKANFSANRYIWTAEQYIIPTPRKNVLLAALAGLLSEEYNIPAPKFGALLAAPGALPVDAYPIQAPNRSALLRTAPIAPRAGVNARTSSLGDPSRFEPITPFGTGRAFSSSYADPSQFEPVAPFGTGCAVSSSKAQPGLKAPVTPVGLSVLRTQSRGYPIVLEGAGETEPLLGGYLMPVPVHGALLAGFGNLAHWAGNIPVPRRGCVRAEPVAPVAAGSLMQASALATLSQAVPKKSHGASRVYSGSYAQPETKAPVPPRAQSPILSLSAGVPGLKAAAQLRTAAIVPVESCGKPEAAPLVRLSGRSMSVVITRAVMAAKSAVWYEPVQGDTDVYIRSVYYQRQEGSDVRLDAES